MPNLLAIRSYSSKPISHSHAFHQLVLPLRGVINIRVDDFNGKVAPGECVIVKSHSQHLFTADAQARFVVADMQQLPDNLLSSQRIVFATNAAMQTYLTFIESQLENNVNVTLERSMFELFTLLLTEQSLLPKLDDRIAQTLSFIAQHLDQPLTIKGLADGVYLSETQFKKLFKQQTHFAVMQYVSKLRIEKAQALLTHTDYPLQMIGEQIGYKDLSAFSRKFSQYVGLSPTQFRQ